VSTPRFFLGAAMLFWGWQSGRLALAAPLALALEAWHWTRLRWDVAPIGFQRVADLCTWALLITAGYLTFSAGMPIPILQIVEWLPVVLAPLVLAQLYSTAGRIELAAFVASLRGARAGRFAHVRVDLAAPFAIVCAIAAGAANMRTYGYFVGVAALSLWALWCARPRRRSAGVWLLAASIATALGYAGHLGLSQAQRKVLDLAVDYLNANLVRTDPYRASTDLGQIGELKTSDRIVLRVTLADGARVPLLLHRASYDLYTSGAWLARDAPFEVIAPRADLSTWDLAASSEAGSTVVVRESMPQGRGVLALPAGGVEVTGLPAAEVKRNRLGTVQVERQPGAAIYAARFAPDATLRVAPTQFDLRVPPAELGAVERIVDGLRLREMRPAAAMQALQRHFETEYRYSTFRPRRAESTPVADFLVRTRSGHCEYFATATVLIARAAGIPARYATGFSVQEWSALQGSYLVRERHAHAWARVYFDGAWHDVDTTPPQWFAEEAARASAWERLRDVWSWIGWELSEWRAREDDRTLPAWTLWVLVPLVAVLAWRIYRAGGFVRRRGQHDHVAAVARPGGDSPFYRIEKMLAESGVVRAPHEPFGEWIERAGRVRPELHVPDLRALLELHYRYRFDPAGLPADERSVFAAGVEQWLAAHRGRGWRQAVDRT